MKQASLGEKITFKDPNLKDCECKIENLQPYKPGHSPGDCWEVVSAVFFVFHWPVQATNFFIAKAFPIFLEDHCTVTDTPCVQLNSLSLQYSS